MTKANVLQLFYVDARRADYEFPVRKWFLTEDARKQWLDNFVKEFDIDCVPETDVGSRHMVPTEYGCLEFLNTREEEFAADMED